MGRAYQVLLPGTCYPQGGNRAQIKAHTPYSGVTWAFEGDGNAGEIKPSCMSNGGKSDNHLSVPRGRRPSSGHSKDDLFTLQTPHQLKDSEQRLYVLRRSLCRRGHGCPPPMSLEVHSVFSPPAQETPGMREEAESSYWFPGNPAQDCMSSQYSLKDLE